MKEKVKTLISHYWEDPERFLGAISPPIFEASNFAFSSYEELEEYQEGKIKKYVYTRGINPTTEILENKLAVLEKGERCKVFSSGVSAISAALLSLLRSGDHIIGVSSVYNPTYEIISTYLSRFDVSSTFVDGKDIMNIKEAIRPNTRLIYLESPTSFTFEIQDLPNIARIAKDRGIYTIIDNTWATPYFQNPIEYGIDIVVHSASKYLGGHSDLVGGAVVTREELIGNIEREASLIGGTLGPFEAWLILRGLRTLPLRMNAHYQNAMKIASFLETHKRIVKVNYPGLSSYPQYNLAKTLMRGFSGVMSFEMEGKEKELKSFINNLKLFKIAVSWGGYESLVFPGRFAFEKNRKDNMVLPSQLIRISVGLEDVEDLLEDLDNALSEAFQLC
ncbi:MAG: trans-sulfuration enzyme family protein [bacterium]